jgi:hypothetical protein
MKALLTKAEDFRQPHWGAFLKAKGRLLHPFRWRRGSGILFFLSIVTLLVYGLWESPCRAGDQGSQGPKSIVALQPFRQTSSIQIKGARGEEGRATLINLNPDINDWYLLQLSWGDHAPTEAYHLEIVNRQNQRLMLDDSNPGGLIVVEGQDKYICELWGTKSEDRLNKARTSGAAYASLCGGKIYLRNPVKGHQTKIEMVTDFLRDEVPGGEKIVAFVRDTFFQYRYQKKAEEKVESKAEKGLAPRKMDNGPGPALLDTKEADHLLKPVELGIEIQDPSPDGMVPGTWYAAKDDPGIYVSVMMPKGITPEILRSYRNVVSGLDSIEAGALVYLVAFDLDRFDLKYALGTEHPRVNWSDHILDRMKDASLPGPDGIGNISPLVSTGLIDPRDEDRTVATFTGGFKRTHGAFKWGELALKNHGSHYGFIENGVLFSRLQPGLATMYALNDGWMDMKTWTEEDNQLLPRIRYARQNGVPIIMKFDSFAQMSVPGPLVSRWGEGNWSGSEDKKLRTMRAGAALQEFQGKRFLLYAFFWSATPSAMARVFQAYRCSYAMLLDMNALEHTYLAVYRRQGSNLYVQHLIRGMSEVDMTVKGQYIPRFLGFSDDRDFFYLTRKGAP